MKKLYITALLASLTLIGGCSDDDDEVIVPPEPPLAVADIDSASVILLELGSFDGPSGELGFTLSDDKGVRLTGASAYSIHYLGMPDEPSRKPKSWQRWHAISSFHCPADNSAPCTGILDAVDDKGNYRFTADGLDWDSLATPDAVGIYKVAIQIHGALASNQVELMTAN
ncbi:hypothetical protein [Shewanella sp. GXUN23E]|uniref:hypothetical protein n=1 Tax=Shewanella sp. GXUN23E TaxID=3422498 RepID=UPI003D7CE3E9